MLYNHFAAAIILLADLLSYKRVKACSLYTCFIKGESPMGRYPKKVHGLVKYV